MVIYSYKATKFDPILKEFSYGIKEFGIGTKRLGTYTSIRDFYAPGGLVSDYGDTVGMQPV